MTAGVIGYDFTCPLSLEDRLAEVDRVLYARKQGRRSAARIRALSH